MPASDPPSVAPASEGRRGRILLAVKVVVTVSLLTWLVRSGGLNFSTLRLLWTNPLVFVGGIFNFFVGILVSATLRWRLLLSALGIELSLKRAFGLQLVGLFFNFYVPGNVSGDLLKNHAVVDRDAGRLVAVALTERVTGLIGLVWVAAPAIAYSASALIELPQGRELIFAVGTLFVGSLFGLFVSRALLLRLGDGSGQRAREAGWILRVIAFVKSHLKSGLSTLKVIAERPRVVFQAIALSMMMHGIAILNFWIIARFVSGPQAELSQMALVYPLGVLSIILPVSISGMGVGHVLFNALFAMIGLSRGADVFNIQIFSGMVPALCGVVPYLLMRGRARQQGDE